MPQVPSTNNESITTNLLDLLESFGEPLFSLGQASISIFSLLTCIGLIILAFIFSTILRKVLSKVYKKKKIDEGLQHSLNRLLHYIIIALGIFIAVDNLGVSLSALAAIGGVLLVGVGFGLQDLAKDFISGLILLLERPVRKGDFIEVDSSHGTITEIGLRATVINTYDDIEILIPNGKLINDVVVNRMFKEPVYRIRINVGVAYDSDPEKVRDILISIAKAHPDILKTPEPKVFFEHFKASYLDFRLMGWLDNARLEPRVKSDLHYEVNKAFREEGINMPFPQLDLHMREGWGKMQEK